MCVRCFMLMLIAALAGPHVIASDVLELSGYGKAFLSRSEADDDARYDQVDRLRLRTKYQPAEAWTFAADYEVRLRWSSEARDPGATSARSRFMDLETAHETGDKTSIAQGLDRCWARYEPDGNMQWTVGRQAVSWGTGMIWSPVDVFAAFSPTEIDREEKPGVDVARLVWSLPGGGSVDLVAEPLDLEQPWHVNAEDSSYAGRAGFHLGEVDGHLYAGTIQSDRMLGVDFAGYAGDAGVHGELMHTWVDEKSERDYTRAMLGADYGFAAPWNPYLLIEYFYNGLGEVDADDYAERITAASVERVFARGTAYNIGRDYLGATLRIQPSALVTLSATTIGNLHDASLRQLAAVDWSVRQNVDLIAGLDLGLGNTPGEFTGQSDPTSGKTRASSDIVYLYAKVYF